MRYFFGFLCACALGVGCSDLSSDGGGGAGGTGGTAGAGGVAGTGGMAGMGGMPEPEFRSYLSEAVEFDPDGINFPLEGVEFCQADTENCVTTNELGRAVLDVPSNQEIAITVVKEGYGRWILGDVSDENFGPAGNPVNRMIMYTDAQLAAIAGQLEIQYPWQGGMVGLLRWPSPHAGVTFKPVGSTIEAVGKAFYFDAATEQYSLDLEATTDFFGLWDFILAEGGFTEVVSGEQQFEFGGTAGNCVRPSWGWPGDAPNRIRVPVRDGYVTYGSIVCDQP